MHADVSLSSPRYWRRRPTRASRPAATAGAAPSREAAGRPAGTGSACILFSPGGGGGGVVGQQRAAESQNACSAALVGAKINHHHRSRYMVGRAAWHLKRKRNVASHTILAHTTVLARAHRRGTRLVLLLAWGLTPTYVRTFTAVVS
jgi:hypothetical protein